MNKYVAIFTDRTECVLEASSVESALKLAAKAAHAWDDQVDYVLTAAGARVG